MVDDPAHYRWSSYRHNALGQANPYLTAHPLYRALGNDDKERHGAYRALFRTQLDKDAIDDMRLALKQNQPLGNARFYDRIEAMTGHRREAKPRGRPRVLREASALCDAQQRLQGRWDGTRGSA